MTTLTLKKPISVNGTEVTSIEIEEPTIGGVEAFETAKAAGESDTAATLKMLAADLDWPLSAVRRIKASDMLKISEALAPFVAADGHTGE